ncbi:unnamed protein product [Lactuca virosa]|uniref:Uncharacterized protein n=1 Tax=Lactuca virosa TaxID=75947 RepID=A0AAU9NDX2_9ASTR|nr:unnamed protein product [Lactuca virosa]
MDDLEKVNWDKLKKSWIMMDCKLIGFVLDQWAKALKAQIMSHPCTNTQTTQGPTGANMEIFLLCYMRKVWGHLKNIIFYLKNLATCLIAFHLYHKITFDPNIVDHCVHRCFRSIAASDHCILFHQSVQIQVGRARKKYNVSYPALFATEADTKDYKLFNCIQRGHQNSMESMPIFFVLMVLGGFKHPLICSALGLAYTVTKFFYFKGYSFGDPKGRLSIGGFNGLEEAKINYNPN